MLRLRLPSVSLLTWSLAPLARSQLAMSGLAVGFNALSLDLRQRDLLSNAELASLTFEKLQLTARQTEGLRGLPHVARLGLTTVLPAR